MLNRLSERFYTSAGLITALIVITIFIFILLFSLPVLFNGKEYLLLDWQWQPDAGHFGILPMLCGSMILSVSALFIAFPLALGVTLSLQGVGRFPKKPLWWLIRFMTAIPTVVYGFASVFLLTPIIQNAFGGSGLSWLSAALVMSLLILPTIVLIMHNGFSAAYHSGNNIPLYITIHALGLSTTQGVIHIIFPVAKRTIFAAILLGFSRAIGDTIIPLMLSGNNSQLPHHFIDGLRTLTAQIALVMASDVTGAAYASLFAAGGLLLLSCFLVQCFLRFLAPTQTEQTVLSLAIQSVNRRNHATY